MFTHRDKWFDYIFPVARVQNLKSGMEKIVKREKCHIFKYVCKAAI